MNDDIRIGVVGLGYVGLTTAVTLAEMGWPVIGTDANPDRLAMIKNGRPPFHEPGVRELLQTHKATGRLRVVSDVDALLESATVVFLCVGTSAPTVDDSGLSQLESAAVELATNLKRDLLVVLKSTSPVMTSLRVRETIRRYNTSTFQVEVACNPEFLREGSALEDLLDPYRIVLGVESSHGRDVLMQIYAKLDCPKIVTDVNTAEIIKHAANAFLSARISFINLVSDLCDATKADISKVTEALGHDPRIGSAYLNAGIGFGGSCLPKDLRALIQTGSSLGVNMGLISSIEQVNNQRAARFVSQLKDRLWVLRGKSIGILGLSFKPGTDDIRDAPSIAVIEQLLKAGSSLRLYDPQAMENAKKVIKPGDRVMYLDSAADVARGVDALLLVTEWPEFSEIDPLQLSGLMRVALIGDGRNFLDPVRFRAAGFEYFSMGRP